jgi:hypothetical protein
VFLGLQDAVSSLWYLQVALVALSPAENVLFSNTEHIHLQVLGRLFAPHQNIAISHRRRPISLIDKSPLNIFNIYLPPFAVLVKL